MRTHQRSPRLALVEAGSRGVEGSQEEKGHSRDRTGSGELEAPTLRVPFPQRTQEWRAWGVGPPCSPGGLSDWSPGKEQAQGDQGQLVPRAGGALGERGKAGSVLQAVLRGLHAHLSEPGTVSQAVLNPGEEASGAT